MNTNVRTTFFDSQAVRHVLPGIAAPRSGSKDERVEQAIKALARGEIVIVTDDDDRECEGDMICAASLCTPEKMAFIIRHGCGIVCAPVTAGIAGRLNLDPMVAINNAPLTTAFTVSVDVIHGLGTGISATERCNTVRGLANANLGAADFVRPGHLFPLVAREGGVLMRSGHTEAAVDLCTLAGQPGVGVICELMNDDGSVMKGRQINDFAESHELVHLSIDSLIAYRLGRESLISQTGTFTADSPIGPLAGHSFTTPFDAVTHYAFVFGDIGSGENVLTRLHRADIVEDVLGGARDLNAALARIAEEGSGVIVYLRDSAARVAFHPRPESLDIQRRDEWREVGLGAQILRHLNVQSIRELASRERSFVGLEGFNLQIVSTERL